MTLERELEEALAAARSHAHPGEEAVAVMATEPGADGRVYVVAFASGEEELAYVALDAGGAPVSDRRVVKDAVTLAALAERAEEVSGATAADDLVERFGGVVERLPKEPAGAAADAVVAAARRLGEAATGPRVATPVYLDRMAALAGELAGALDAFVPLAQQLPNASMGIAGPPPPRDLAEAALAVAARAGDPANFAQAMTAASGAVDALVADVVDHYRGALVDA
jgi:hypothetical protein